MTVLTTGLFGSLKEKRYSLFLFNDLLLWASKNKGLFLFFFLLISFFFFFLFSLFLFSLFLFSLFLFSLFLFLFLVAAQLKFKGSIELKNSKFEDYKKYGNEGFSLSDGQIGVIVICNDMVGFLFSSL